MARHKIPPSGIRSDASTVHSTRRKREQFWREKIDAEKSTPSQLRRSIDALLGRGRVPPVSDISASQFHRHFDDKVAGVRSETISAPL